MWVSSWLQCCSQVLFSQIIVWWKAPQPYLNMVGHKQSRAASMLHQVSSFLAFISCACYYLEKPLGGAMNQSNSEWALLHFFYLHFNIHTLQMSLIQCHYKFSKTTVNCKSSLDLYDCAYAALQFCFQWRCVVHWMLIVHSGNTKLGHSETCIFNRHWKYLQCARFCSNSHENIIIN